MAGLQVTLTAAERDTLIDVLETDLKEIRVEEHRTRAPKYREHLVAQENAMASVLAKLKAATETR